MANLIHIENLHKQFGNLKVLQGLDLTVQKGETLVILGRSGVGKSVLLKHILGIEQADLGTITIDGINIATAQKKETKQVFCQMGMLFQGAALFDSMNVGDNVAFYLQQHGNLTTGKSYSKSEIRHQVAKALAQVSLSGTEKKMPSELSGGMRKRAALARLIIYHPSIILYDEPTTGLDPITAMHINGLIVNIQKKLHATSLVVTHDIYSAMQVADRIALHDEGKIVYIADKKEFIKIDDSRVKQFFEYSICAQESSL